MNVEVKNEVKNKFMEVEEIKNEIARIEGLMEGSGRVLIRPSGTQPLVRVMLEGKEEGQINELANNLANSDKGFFSSFIILDNINELKTPSPVVL